MSMPSPSLLDPAHYELHIVRGSTLPITFRFRYDDGTLEDLTGSTFTMFIVWPGGRIEHPCSVNTLTAEVVFSPANADHTRMVPPLGGRFELLRKFPSTNFLWTEIMGPVFGLGGITEPD
jgi:hypothetical protein